MLLQELAETVELVDTDSLDFVKQKKQLSSELYFPEKHHFVEGNIQKH